MLTFRLTLIFCTLKKNYRGKDGNRLKINGSASDSMTTSFSLFDYQEKFEV